MNTAERLAKLEAENAALRAMVQEYANATPHALKLLRKGSYAEECLLDANKKAELAFDIKPKGN